MAISKKAQQYHERMFPGYVSSFLETDPEFIELFDNFAFDEVVGSDDLDDRTRMMAILATLLGCQGIDEFRAMLPAALNFGVTPTEAKEIVYQSVAYLGIGRVFPFLRATNDVLEQRGVTLPLPGQSRTTTEDRLKAGIQAQVDIFGDGMKEFWKSRPDETRHINRWLAENCFGDYYTRSGLDYKLREMITFCFLAAQGGCEPQVVSHAKANMKIGNNKAFLIKIISQCLPFIGTVRNRNKVTDLIEKYPNTFTCEILDVTDVPAIRAVVNRSFESSGRIDVIASNAGYGLFGAAEELSDAEVDHIIATNLTGSIRLIRSALPHLRAQGGGRVIQLSTYGGQVTFPGNSMYHAT